MPPKLTIFSLALLAAFLLIMAHLTAPTANHCHHQTALTTNTCYLELTK